MDIVGLILQRRDDLAASQARLADLQDQVVREKALRDQIKADINDLSGYLVATGKTVP